LVQETQLQQKRNGMRQRQGPPEVKHSPSATAEIESKEVENLCAEINSLSEECGQFNELLKLEEFYSREAMDQLKLVMTPRKARFHINPATVARDVSSITDAVLTSDGVVCLLDKNGEVVHGRPLREFQSGTFLKILDEILPEVQNLVKDLQGRTHERVSSIERIAKELRKILLGAIEDQERMAIPFST
jgi:hypothetical protein